MRMLLVIVLATIATSAGADLRVEDPRIGWIPRWVPHPAFLELTNEGDTPVTLTGARSDSFARIEFKAAEDSDLFIGERMQMPLAVHPGDTLTFEPGGAYLLLLTQSSWLDPGERVTIELLFRERDPLPIEFTVRKIRQ